MELKGFKPKKITGKLKQIEGKVLATVQIAEEGNEVFKSELSVYRVEDEYCVYLHDNQSIPSIRQVKEVKYIPYEKILLTKEEAYIVVKSIHLWEELKHYHLNPYNIVILGCLMRGLDLVKKGVIKL